MFIRTEFYEKDHVAKIILDGPFFNLLNSKLLAELFDVLDSLERQFPKYGAIILTGSETCFSAGASIDEFEDDDFLKKYDRLSSFFYDKMANYPIPIIAAVDGYCFGGGFELLLSCDIILITKSLKLGLPELKLGLIPGFGGTQRLTSIVGKHRSMELILTSKIISGEDLYDLKIANHLYDSYHSLQVGSLQMAHQIASGFKLANKNAKLSISNSLSGLEEGSIHEAELFRELFNTSDKKRGVTKFLDRTRKPKL